MQGGAGGRRGGGWRRKNKGRVAVELDRRTWPGEGSRREVELLVLGWARWGRRSEKKRCVFKHRESDITPGRPIPAVSKDGRVDDG